MFWFWFRIVFLPLMIVLDAAWWVISMRLAKRRLWRIVISIFMAAQTIGLVLALAGHWRRFDFLGQTPKPFLVAVTLWHFFGVAVLVPGAILFLSAWLVRGIGRLTGARRERPAAIAPSGNSLTRREFMGAAVALAPPLFTIGLTGVALAQLSHLRVRRFTVSVPTLPRALDGMTIAHVSDIHVGRLTSGKVLREMVNMTNSLRADLVLLTGDLINYELSDLSEGISRVKGMEGRCGLWMIEGNHDLFENSAEFESRVKASGIPLLLNESATANVRGYRVQLLGLRWADGFDARQCEKVSANWVRDLAKQRQPDAFPILLAHHPHTFDAAAAADLPLTLSGHTHGGQLMLDSKHGVAPWFFRYWSGLYARGSNQLIVSNGVGNWFPLRVNAPAEIVHITLRCV